MYNNTKIRKIDFVKYKIIQKKGYVMKKRLYVTLFSVVVLLFAFNSTVLAAEKSGEYTLADKNGMILEFETFEQVENHIQTNTSQNNNSAITPFYRPCGPGQHRGPFRMEYTANYYEDGRVVFTMYYYKCFECEEVFYYETIYW